MRCPLCVMPARRSFKSRARAAKRKGRVGYANIVRKGARSMARRKLPLNTHCFSRYAQVTTYNMSGLETPADLQFQLGYLPSSSEFANLFDQYKITRVVLKVQMITNPDSTQGLNNVGVNPTNWFPKVWYITDSDGGPSETINTIKERVGVKCRILRPNQMLRVSVRPCVQVQTYRTAVTTGYAPKRLFLDMSATDVPHHGIKMVFDSNGIVPTGGFYPFTFRVEAQYFFTCKGVR